MAPDADGFHASIQPSVAAATDVAIEHAAVGAIPRTARLRRRRCDRRERWPGPRPALAAASAQRVTGVPARTLRRWLRWWRGPFTTKKRSAPFVELSAPAGPLVVSEALTADFDPATIGRRAGRNAHPSDCWPKRWPPSRRRVRPMGHRFLRGPRMTDRAPRARAEDGDTLVFSRSRPGSSP